MVGPLKYKLSGEKLHTETKKHKFSFSASTRFFAQSFVMQMELVMFCLKNFTEAFVVPFELVICSLYELLCLLN